MSLRCDDELSERHQIIHCQFILILICELYIELMVFQTRSNIFFCRREGGGRRYLASISISNLCTKYSMTIGLCVDDHLLVDGRWQFAKLTLPYLSFLLVWKQKKWDNNTNTVASQTRPMEAVGSNCQLCHFAVGFNKKRIIFNLITLNFFWKSTTILIISNGILLCFTGSWINQKIAIWS